MLAFNKKSTFPVLTTRRPPHLEYLFLSFWWFFFFFFFYFFIMHFTSYFSINVYYNMYFTLSVSILLCLNIPYQNPTVGKAALP